MSEWDKDFLEWCEIMKLVPEAEYQTVFLAGKTWQSLADNWISVKDRLPEAGVDVIALDIFGCPIISRIIRNKCFSNGTDLGLFWESSWDDEITHWMEIPPLKEPNKEDANFGSKAEFAFDKLKNAGNWTWSGLAEAFKRYYKKEDVEELQYYISAMLNEEAEK